MTIACLMHNTLKAAFLRKKEKFINIIEGFWYMDWYNILLFISLLLVVFVLAWGLITMARGGEYNKSKSNMLMRYRIIFQAIAILIFVCLLLYKRSTNG
jgi:hypothetical protein